MDDTDQPKRTKNKEVRRRIKIEEKTEVEYERTRRVEKSGEERRRDGRRKQLN